MTTEPQRYGPNTAAVERMLRRLGNAVVPQVAEAIGRAILDQIDQETTSVELLPREWR